MNTKTEELGSSLLGRESVSYCDHDLETPDLFGEISSMIADKKASTALSFGMKGKDDPRSLSDRLTPLLISFGLVRGTTPISTRKRLGAKIPDIALKWPDGETQEQLRRDYLSWKDNSI